MSGGIPASSNQESVAGPKTLGFAGLRVLSLESRRAREMAKLIENHGGAAVSAPSLREAPLADNPAALNFAAELFAGRIDALICLTGVGTRILFQAIETRHPREQLVEQLSRTAIIARGPKPIAVLREYGVPVNIAVPEPNTWRDLLAAIKAQRPELLGEGKRIAVQEYGATNEELLHQLAAGGASVERVPVYQWALPEDVAPLRAAIAEIIAGRIDVLIATSAMQIHHLMQVANEMQSSAPLRAALEKVVIASIGPICTEALRSYGLSPDLEPTHPKMGQLVFETAGQAQARLKTKR